MQLLEKKTETEYCIQPTRLVGLLKNKGIITNNVIIKNIVILDKQLAIIIANFSIDFSNLSINIHLL